MKDYIAYYVAYILIAGGLGLSIENLIILFRYFRERKSVTIPPFLGGIFLMVGMMAVFPGAGKFWYLFLMLDVSFYVWPCMLVVCVFEGFMKLVRFLRNK